MIKEIQFNNVKYPAFQVGGNAAKFCLPFALEVCNGFGYDIGCGKIEWSFPGSFPIDSIFDDGYSAQNLPEKQADYIFSSHVLEHIPNWVLTLDYWYEKLADEGVLFLYLPDISQEYHRPWNNRKHVNVFTPQIIKEYLMTKYKKVYVSGVDLYNSFMVMAEK